MSNTIEDAVLQENPWRFWFLTDTPSVCGLALRKNWSLAMWPSGAVAGTEQGATVAIRARWRRVGAIYRRANACGSKPSLQCRGTTVHRRARPWQGGTGRTGGPSVARLCGACGSNTWGLRTSRVLGRRRVPWEGARRGSNGEAGTTRAQRAWRSARRDVAARCRPISIGSVRKRNSPKIWIEVYQVMNRKVISHYPLQLLQRL
jgi:hypothetical protein